MQILLRSMVAKIANGVSPQSWRFDFSPPSRIVESADNPRPLALFFIDGFDFAFLEWALKNGANFLTIATTTSTTSSAPAYLHLQESLCK